MARETQFQCVVDHGSVIWTQNHPGERAPELISRKVRTQMTRHCAADFPFPWIARYVCNARDAYQISDTPTCILELGWCPHLQPREEFLDRRARRHWGTAVPAG